MRKTKLILVALVAVLAAGFAFAVQTEVPALNTVGFLYNKATGQFITADANMGEQGVEFIIKERKDCGDSFGSDDGTVNEAGYTYVRFGLNGTSDFMRMTKEGVVCKASGYHKWAVKATDKGLEIRCIYSNTQASGALDPFAKQGFYLTPDANGKLALMETAEEASYWQFVSQEEADAIAAEKQEEADAKAGLPELIKTAKELKGNMSVSVKAALAAALTAAENAEVAKPAYEALQKAYVDAYASIIAYKGVESSYKMHQSFLTEAQLEAFEARVKPIMEALAAGTVEGDGMKEMAEIARASQDAKGAKELESFEVGAQCYVSQQYLPGANHGITIDWDAIAKALKVEKSALKIYAVLPDGTFDENYGVGSKGTDGWRDAAGNFATWNSQDNLFFVQFKTAGDPLALTALGCMRTDAPTKYTAEFKVVNSADVDGNWVTLKVSLDVVEVPVTTVADFNEKGSVDLAVNVYKTTDLVGYSGPYYFEDFDAAAIASALGVESLKATGVDLWCDKHEESGAITNVWTATNGYWMTATGTPLAWGAEGMAFYVEWTDAGLYTSHSAAIPAADNVNQTATLYFIREYAGAENGKKGDLYKLNIKVGYLSDIEPVRPAAPAAVALDLTGETTQYFYNVEAKAFMAAGNDWGTRASIATAGLPMKFVANGETYKLSDFRNGSWNAFDCSAVDQIWVDGQGRTGDGLWTFEVAEDGSFTISNTNVAGKLSVVPSKNDTRLYMSEEQEAQSTWIAVTQESLDAYAQALNEYVTTYNEWFKRNYKVGDNILAVAPKTWEGQTGTYGSRYERYSGAGSIATGDVLTQTLTGLKNGEYMVSLEVAASFTSGRGFECPTGEELTEAFANDGIMPLEVIDRTGVAADGFTTATFTVYVVDGTLKYGIRNIADAGNWYVANVTSIIYQSASIPAPIIIEAGDVTAIEETPVKVAPKGIYNLAGQKIDALQKGLNIVDGKKVYVK